MKILALAVLFSLFLHIESAGFLRLLLTADSDCLVHLEHPFGFSETVRLLAYETRSLDIASPTAFSPMPLRLQMLHHFSGKPLSDVSIQEFKTENTGRWMSRVVDSDSIILSVQSIFRCDQGYFGSLCEHKSRSIETSTVSVATPASSEVISFDFEISDNTIIYSSLAFLVLLLIVANICFCCSRTGPSHTYQDTLHLAEPNVFCIDEHSGYLFNNDSTRYFDAPSRFLSSTTIQSMV